MKVYTTKLLNTFDWHSIQEFMHSMAPSFKYKMNVGLMVISFLWAPVCSAFGLDGAAALALLLVFIIELVTGIVASGIRQDKFSSMKLSRFLVKVAAYLVVIYVTQSFAENFKHHNDLVAMWVFDWMHIFLLMQIVFENIISILENLAEISGKPKAAWIEKIREKFNSIIS